MKFYIFVEGKETEMYFYPALIHFFHHNKYTKADSLSEMTDNSYVIFSGLGMPRTFQRITNCLEEICDYNSRSNPKVNVFAVVFDRDRYGSVKAASQAICDRFNQAKNKELIQKCGIKHFYIIQDPCIETWFLANSSFIPQNFDYPELKDLLHKFDIHSSDPEKLSLDGMNDAEAARYYLDVIFKAKGIPIGYHKRASMEMIAKNDYIHEIYKSFNAGNISSFKYVVDLMNIL